MSPLNTPSIDRLFAVIADLQTVEDCRQFFEDVCTIKEVQDMAQRLDAAILLESGVGYQAVTREVGLSTATISRVSRSLNYGSGGYHAAIRRLKEREVTP